MQQFPSKEEFANLPEAEQKALVDKTNKMVEDIKPLNRAERRAAEKNKQKQRRLQRKQDGTN